MKAFRFRLERVLDWRRRALDQTLARQEKLRADVKFWETEIRKRKAAMVLTVEPLMSGLDLAAYQSFLGRLKNDLVSLELHLQTAKDALKRQAALVLEADRNVKTLERLREQRVDEWTSAMEKELEELTADVISNRWASTPRGNP